MAEDSRCTRRMCRSACEGQHSDCSGPAPLTAVIVLMRTAFVRRRPHEYLRGGRAGARRFAKPLGWRSHPLDPRNCNSRELAYPLEGMRIGLTYAPDSARWYHDTTWSKVPRYSATSSTSTQMRRWQMLRLLRRLSVLDSRAESWCPCTHRGLNVPKTACDTGSAYMTWSARSPLEKS